MIEQYTPTQLDDIRTFDNSVQMACNLERVKPRSPQAEYEMNRLKHGAFNLYYHLTRHIVPEGTVIDRQMKDLLNKRLEEHGIKQFYG